MENNTLKASIGIDFSLIGPSFMPCMKKMREDMQFF